MARPVEQGARSLDPWRRLHPIDEPIYCPAPSPSGPDDIIYPGSDDETDEAAKLAKRRRYEQCGRRYLQGRPLHIFSASLRGPFEKSSGWQNPWLPKPPPPHDLHPNHAAPRIDAPPAFRYESGIPYSSLSSRTDGLSLNIGDSMRCHLPSPQSQQNLQFIQTPSPFEKRSLIRSWAEQVQEGMFEKDQFWAPSHDSSGSTDLGLANKRPSGREWLKRRSVKNRRTDSSQSPMPASTPTPMPNSLPSRDNKKDSNVGKMSAHRNYGITPLSGSEEGSSDPSDTARNRQVASSTGPATSAWMRTVLSVEDESEQVEEEQKAGRDTGSSSDMYERQPKRQRIHESKPPEPVVFEDYADDSFCYRARQPKRVLPPNLSGAVPADFSKTPTLSKQRSSKNASSSPNTASSHSVTPAEHRKHLDMHSGSSVLDTANKRTDIPVAAALKLDHILTKDNETPSRKCDTPGTGAPTSHSSRSNVGRPSRDAAPTGSTNSHGTASSAPMTLPKVKHLRTAHEESLVGDGTTLIGDQMDIDSPTDIKSTKPILPGKQTNASQKSRDGVTRHRVIDTIKSAAAATVQQGAAESDSESSRPSHGNSQESVSGSIIDANPASSQAKRESPQTRGKDQAVPAEQQSPWVGLSSGGSVGRRDDILVQAKDHGTTPSASSVEPLRESQARLYHTPAIRPSQQSPWAQDNTKSTNSTKRGRAESPRITAAVNTESPKKRQDLGLPANQQPAPWSGSHSAISPRLDSSSRVPRDDQRLGSDFVVGEERATLKTLSSPYTPIAQAVQPPLDGEVSIRSFSNFNLSSPRQSIYRSASSINRSILSSRKHASTQKGSTSKKRVSFAPLPHEQDDSISQSPTRTRPASPPPPTLVDLEGDNVDGKYRNHFSLMNSRISVHKMPKPQYKQRLLPSSSQQIPASPPIDAMARVFREADAQHFNMNGPADENQSNEADEVESGDEEVREEARDEETEDRPQSPWREESQGDDDVAAVIGHLDEFLDVWDVDTEIEKNRAEIEAEKRETPSSTDRRILHGVGIW